MINNTYNFKCAALVEDLVWSHLEYHSRGRGPIYFSQLLGSTIGGVFSLRHLARKTAQKHSCQQTTQPR